MMTPILLVLSNVIHRQAQATEYDICAPLVSDLFKCKYDVLKQIHHRYDLNALFLKAFSNFSVNVQGLSRVRRIAMISPAKLTTTLLLGNVPFEGVLLGS